MEKLLKFKAWLVENQISQAEVAELLGITRQLANAKLNGREEFTLSQVRTLCKHYGISADNFFV